MRSFLKWVLIVFIVALVPVVVNFGVEHINIGVGNNETWIGFWGSYIGAIVTAFVFYFSLRNAVKKLKIEGHPYLLFSFIRDIKKDYDEDIKVIYHSNNSDVSNGCKMLENTD
ncbi:hypothetical protein KBX49_12130 [Liquorilactobacillus satsumensis]|uniref:hypothetical protein n=1 Tax=Liquorilactobacillus satsumensis TaxID=259059 RepID=UPI0021C2FD64|nr:hypothetical protein [Liquorilactobacillus satsumensis]MCP9358687.1 hypothetical protein [Liquorilactobacillus satsumensis]MCP9372636.1 hypothetical protein [Liquorilactobacillus satsumensis]